MATYTTSRNWLSIAAGILAGGAATSLLIRDGFATGFTLDHALMPVLVGLTVVFWLLGVSAWNELRVFAGSAILALAVAGSAMVIYETTGRRAEVRDAKVLNAGAAQAERAHLMQMRAEAEETLAKHRAEMATDCKRGPGSKACKGKAYTVKTWEAAVSGYEAKLTAIPAAPVDPKAERVAKIAQMLGFSGVPVREFVQTMDPMFFPLFLEAGAIVAFGFGFGHARRRDEETVAPEAKATEFENVSQITDEDLAELKKILRGKTPVNNKQLADMLGVSTGEASKRASAAVAAGIVNRERVGKNALISLAH